MTAVYFLVLFLAILDSKLLPQRKVTRPMRTRYLTVVNMLSCRKKYMYRVKIPPRPVWKPRQGTKVIFNNYPF